MNHRWPPGLPTRNTRVAIDCGAKGHQLGGTVIESGPEVCIVRWDHGVEQAHPIKQLVPERKEQ